ncbi:MAG: haloacid dehalogenase [Phycisphaerae bacterium]|nr:haloacid dehalogenase [Phycisphaerae bacterium]
MNNDQPLVAIFDLDGTLADSYDHHHISWKLLARENGVEVTDKQFHEHFGRKNREMIDGMWRRSGRPVPNDQEYRALSDRKEQLFRDHASAEFPVMNGALELLRSLHQAGWRLAVGSSAPRANVELTLVNVDPDDLFEAVVTGNDVSQGKPEPEVFLKAAELMGTSPQQCIVVEDARAGIEAAHRAGMPAVALCSRGHTHEELSDAELVVDSLDDLNPQRLGEILAGAIDRSRNDE